MKVLLCQDIQRVGWLGDVVEVSVGYARNYLLPQGLAKAATENNSRAIAQEKVQRAEERIKEQKRMAAAAEALAGAEAVLAAKANEQGHLFGSITEKMIAENLRAQGFQVANEIVVLHDHIKEVGVHTVILKFAEGIQQEVKVTVVAEGAEPAAEAEVSNSPAEPEAVE
jgi:large subunit ribosomal protein L9